MSDAVEHKQHSVMRSSGYHVGVIVRYVALGFFLSLAVVEVIGHDPTTRVFRYEGF